ncbi:unnamed protein product [Mycena citricolor]|uniref:Xylanolytic transcriptional activator regulatory domain-containing protein n=1 Tax=Mycena citricolor TaxID=2018698 RepID=A0AAD2H5S3_9AGAR|nr:unnamed protein product [Mycena citricolor]
MAQPEPDGEGRTGEPANSHQRHRRPGRSCDSCRSRKSAVLASIDPRSSVDFLASHLLLSDGPYMESKICSNCAAFGTECAYLAPPQKRGPKDRLVDELRKKIASLESKLRSQSICSLCAQPLQHRVSNHSSPDFSSSDSVFVEDGRDKENIEVASVEKDPPVEEDFEGEELAKRLEQFSISEMSLMNNKFYGASSCFSLAHTAMKAVETYFGQTFIATDQRPQFYTLPPWEAVTRAQMPQYMYPEQDMITRLVDLYFAFVHPTLPILHRPSFEHCVSQGLHFRNKDFGALLLTVLALASRYSDDPRVLIDGRSTLSSGWRFANQVNMHGMWEPTIYGVQYLALMTVYIRGTSVQQTARNYLASRRSALSWSESTETETEPGGFPPPAIGRTPEEARQSDSAGTVFVLDQTLSTHIGRPAGFHVEEYDTDLPLEVDDEYWEDGFQQPPDKPASYSFFVHYIRLCEILGDALRRLYGSRKSKLLMGWNGAEWEEDVVKSLDSQINAWLSAVPTHLRWKTDNVPKDQTTFDQAALLYAQYNYVQIVIHRPFIKRDNPLAAPSLSICVGAARCIIQTAEAWLQRLQVMPSQTMITSVIVASLVLVLNMFGSRKAGPASSRDFVQVEAAQRFMKFAEARNQSAGRLWEILESLKIYIPHSNNQESAGCPADSAVASSEFEFQYGMSIEQLLQDNLWSHTETSSDLAMNDDFMSMWTLSDFAGMEPMSDSNKWDPAFLDNF